MEGIPMSLKELLSKRKAELVTLAKKFRLRGVFQLPKETLAKRLAAVSAQAERSKSTQPRKRARGMRSVSQRKSSLATMANQLADAKPGGTSSGSKKARPTSSLAKPSRPAGSSATRAVPPRVTTPVASVPPALVVSHRYEMPETQRQKFIPEDLGELPESYGTGKLFLTARDPYWLYSYWDFTRDQMHNFRMQARNGTVHLRVCDVTGVNFNGYNAPIAQELALDPNARDWYVHLGQAGRNCVAQLGFYEPNGNFRVVATSRVARTPSDHVSGDTRARFVTIPFEIPFVQLKEMVRQFLREGGELADVLAQLQEEGYPFP